MILFMSVHLAHKLTPQHPVTLRRHEELWNEKILIANSEMGWLNETFDWQTLVSVPTLLLPPKFPILLTYSQSTLISTWKESSQQSPKHLNWLELFLFPKKPGVLALPGPLAGLCPVPGQDEVGRLFFSKSQQWLEYPGAFCWCLWVSDD